MKQYLLRSAVLTIIVLIAFIASSGITAVSGGGYNDVVEELYKQEVSKNPTLEKIEADIRNYASKKEDALQAYNKFYDYNRRYYADAKIKINAINDAVAKEKANNAILLSEKNYNIKMAEWNKQIIETGNLETKLRNYQSLLKIIITTPAIEQYQNKALPSTAPLLENNTDATRIIEAIKKITDK